ncbi:MAG TPA: hypothetical protein VEO95_11280, partial [Chthoniobacteraceae bacterium]|nr:hypothetical protein [Chthoniobacteraceae bacterium]
GPDPASVQLPGECCPLLEGEPPQPQFHLAEKPAAIRDSYTEFANGVWQHIIRAKRAYRRIAPSPELENGRQVHSVDEQLHESVQTLRAENEKRRDPKTGKRHDPPNLFEFLKRDALQKKAAFNEAPPPHVYLEGKLAWVWLVVWLLGIACAGWCVAQFAVRHVNGWRLFGMDTWRWLAFTQAPLFGRIPWSRLHQILAVIFPLIAFFADWFESRLNHRVALEPDGLDAERRKSLVDFFLLIRLGALVAFFAGVIATLLRWFALDGPPAFGRLFAFLKHLLTLDWRWPLEVGWLFFLAALLLLYHAAKAWCGGPMTDAGLGSIVQLQFARKPGTVRAVLTKWAGDNPALLAPAARCLWRDMLGFIPAYTVVLFFGTWLALSLCLPVRPEINTFGGLLVWTPAVCIKFAAVIAILCALADYLEDIIHLKYLRSFPDEKSPSAALVFTASSATLIKVILFLLGMSLTCLAALWLAAAQIWKVLRLESGGFGLLAAVAVLLVIFAVVQDFLAPLKKPRKSQATAVPPA